MSIFGQRSGGLDNLFHRPRAGLWSQFLEKPCVFLARRLYQWKPTLTIQPPENPISIVCISDTHNSQPLLPDGDVLIHAGDLTQSGTLHELQSTLNWLRAQPHLVKIVVAGNHDLLLDPSQDRSEVAAKERSMLEWGDIIYLENTETTVQVADGRQLRIYGSPLSARHGNWAFQYSRNDDVWAGKIPGGVDIVITHGPPRGHLDLLRWGCVHLLQTLWRVRPRLHVFGHIHEGAGTECLQFDGLQHAYEHTVIAGGGVWNLARTLVQYVKAWLRPSGEDQCLLVNASIVGGLRDNKRRQPVRIVI